MLIWLECRNLTYKESVFYWTIEPEVGEIVNQFGYILEVSESNQGPWLHVYEDPIYAFGYVDTTTQRGMIDQRLYYRIKAQDLNHNVFYSDPICLVDEKSNNISEYIADVESLLLRRLSGEECLLYTRRKFGERCPVCYDHVQKKSIKPKCKVCFGTTYKRGYFAPIKIYFKIDQEPKQIDKTDYGVNEANRLTGWTSNEIIVENDDIIIFLDKPSKRYLISGIDPTYFGGNTVRQPVTLIQLKADHPGQLLKVDFEAYDLSEFNIFRREWDTCDGL